MSIFEKSTWYSERMRSEATLARWGVVGQPVLMFPTAGGDAEEIERFLMIRALGPLIEAGRVAPVMDSEFALAEASGAHARMESSAHIGKIVLRIAG